MKLKSQAVMFALVSGLAFAPAAVCRAQAQAQTHPQTTEVAKLDDPSAPTPAGAADSPPTTASNTSPAKADPVASSAILDELDAMKRRIVELESELASRSAGASAETTEAVPAGAPTVANTPNSSSLDASAVGAASSSPDPQGVTAAPKEKPKPAEPFSLYDYTWMNGNSRNHDTPLATKYFSPEFRADTNYTMDYSHPVDHTLGGSTETFRSGEVQVEQLSFGGDLRVNNIRGRVLTMFGEFSTTTSRNDASVAVGNWDLKDAYQYVSEAWGGYHFNVNHGLNVDAGIFVSYIGLFSYYNFDNWAYQPSFVSSNTPWFFNGLRIQWFPTAKLKIEPWFINGWQSYAKFNSRPGLGGQILWRPNGWFSLVANNYGMGTDTLGNPARSRIHTDDSVEVKYYDHPDRGLDMMAFSVTGDLGCEYGGGVSCFGTHGGPPKQAFIGAMGYDRMQFKKDHFGVTVGGGFLNNPGQYLTLLPPINGATAPTGSVYFPGGPGSKFHGVDGTITFDWMPDQFITFRLEEGYRHSDIPYWTGHGGITPPGGNNGAPQNFACNAPIQTPSGLTTNSGFSDLPNATAACGAGGIWFPDLQHDQSTTTIAIMVKF